MKKKKRKKAKLLAERGYGALTISDGDRDETGVQRWPVSHESEDGDLYRNRWALLNRVRDLFKTTTGYIAYRDQLWAQVYGSEGIMLRSTIKEEADRVIHTADEKAAVMAKEERYHRVSEWACSRAGVEYKRRIMLHFSGDPSLNGTRAAQVKMGEPDVFARLMVERAWKEWQRMEFCDLRGRMNYHTHRQIRLISAVRDGDIFLRPIVSPGINKFGFTLGMVNSEWCDHLLNARLDNGNVIRMGIEHQHTPWGLGKVVAYHFIKRVPRDWQYAGRTLSRVDPATGLSDMHDRVPAEEIIHYTRLIDSDSTRPAPWVASTIPKARRLDEYELAEVTAAVQQATKTGWLYSDLVPEGGYDGETLPDPTKSLPGRQPRSGDIAALKYGVKFQPNDPTHPNGNFENFRRAAMQSLASGMPGANYSTLANDYAAINFSAGRLQRLDSNELYKQIQVFDIDYAERPIFEKWLDAALRNGAIPLPYSAAKYKKFSAANFQGRRWKGVDEVKEVQAAAMRIANKLSSRTRENAEMGQDLEDILIEQAEEEMIMESLGLKTETTAEGKTSATPSTSDSAAAAAEQASIQGTGLNGAQIDALLNIVSKVTLGEITVDTATALISAAFPLMTDAEISAITAKLEAKPAEETPPAERPPALEDEPTED